MKSHFLPIFFSLFANDDKWLETKDATKFQERVLEVLDKVSQLKLKKSFMKHSAWRFANLVIVFKFSFDCF